MSILIVNVSSYSESGWLKDRLGKYNSLTVYGKGEWVTKFEEMGVGDLGKRRKHARLVRCPLGKRGSNAVSIGL